MNRIPSLVAAAFAIASLAGCAPAAESGPMPAATVRHEAQRQDRARFAEAVRLFQAGRWSAAYGRFAELADAGDARAARIALQMLRDGPDFYGTTWSATPAQVAQWEQAAGESARGFQVVALGE